MSRSSFIFALTAVVLIAACGGVRAQRGEPLDPAAFARQEMSRHRRSRDRAEQERIRKSAVDQGTYDVLHYDLQLDIDVENESITGTVSLDALALTGGAPDLVLDLFDVLRVSAVRLDGAPAAFAHQADLLTVDLSQNYAAGDTIHVEVDYGGKPSARNDELQTTAFTFASHGPDPDHRDQLAIYTLSEPYFARAWWPCKDVPGDKASLRLSATVPDTLFVASNGVLAEEIGLPGGRKTFVWQEKYPIATYLVSLAISNYRIVRKYFRHGTEDSMEVACFAYPEHVDGASNDLAVMVPMIAFYSEVFGLYPFADEKYGMAEFGWPGAMEHQTCTSIDSTVFSNKRADDWVIGHELSHQWWGDMVTPVEWVDIWLNEGFATYSEALWVEHQEGVDAYREYVTARRFSRPFPGTLYDPQDLFGLTVYWKGSWVLYMLRRVMGDERFFDALQAYGSDPSVRYKNATTADFQRICENRYGGSLGWFFDEWVYGEGEPAYAYYWAQHAEQRGPETMSVIDLTLQQRQAAGVFTMPIDLRFSFASGDTTVDTTVTVWNDSPVQQYQFVFVRPAASLDVDPDVWILRSVEERALQPLTLSVNPNPFNSTTRIAIELGSGVGLEVDVYDVTGVRVKALFRGNRRAGYHEIEWNGTNDSGQTLSSGVYFVRVNCPSGTLVRKAVLLK